MQRIVFALTFCSLFPIVCDLKATEMSVQLSLIRKFLLYEFERGHIDAEAIKNICSVKGEDTINQRTEFVSKC